MRGLKVLDFGQYIAGPAAAAMLGDLGAEVTRVDPPGGPRWKSPAMAGLNRGKRSICLDLHRVEDLAIARRLVAEADVLIENFRPGVMARLGLGPAECERINPRLVYASLPGFASGDAERASLRAWEGVIAAESGQLTDMGLNRVLMGINPSFTPLTLASAYGALFGVTAICAALYARESSGRGEHIEIPLAAALMEGLVYNSMHVDGYPERYKSPREREIERRKEAGLPLNLAWDDLQEFLDPFYRSYFCADGRPLYVVSASQRGHARRTLSVLGLLEEALAAGVPELENWYLPTSEWPEGIDCGLGLYPLSRRWADWLSTRMKERFRERSSYEWEALFDAAGVPAVAHRTTREWIGSEHALASGLIHETDHPALGRLRHAGPVAWFAGLAERAATPRPAGLPDGDREVILGALGEAAHALPAALQDASRGWLSGVRILDLTNVIAGPTIASTLARFGAEVIKVDPVRSTFDPWNTIVFGMQAGRGKRSVLLDIKDAEGRGALERLVAWADVVTINAVERQLVPLGVDHAALKAINPRVILCQLDAFGGPRRGPRSDHVGYDDLAQAMTGIMARFGGSLDTPEEHAHLGTIDVLAGIAGAFSVAAALVQRERTGEAETARCSLAAAGQLIQAPFMFDFEGRGPFDEPTGRETLGYSALYRLYPTADDWIFLAATDEDLGALAEVIGSPALGELSDADRAMVIGERLACGPTQRWMDLLRERNVGVGRVASLAGLRERHTGDDRPDDTYRFDHFPDHPCKRPVTLFAPCAVRPSRAPILSPGVTEKYGTSTRDVLQAIGYSGEQVDALLKRGVAATSWSRDYLPG